MENDNYVSIISKEKWLKEMKSWQIILAKFLRKYKLAQKLVKAGSENYQILQGLIIETEKARIYNKKLMLRAELEEEYLIYYLDNGTPALFRTMRKKKETNSSYVI